MTADNEGTKSRLAPAAPGGLYCSFCGLPENRVKKLVAGQGVSICNECVALCNDILNEERLGAAVNANLQLFVFLREVLTRGARAHLHPFENFLSLVGASPCTLQDVRIDDPALAAVLAAIPGEAVVVAPDGRDGLRRELHPALAAARCTIEKAVQVMRENANSPWLDEWRFCPRGAERLDFAIPSYYFGKDDRLVSDEKIFFTLAVRCGEAGSPELMMTATVPVQESSVGTLTAANFTIVDGFAELFGLAGKRLWFETEYEAGRVRFRDNLCHLRWEA